MTFASFASFCRTFSEAFLGIPIFSMSTSVLMGRPREDWASRGDREERASARTTCCSIRLLPNLDWRLKATSLSRLPRESSTAFRAVFHEHRGGIVE